MLGSAPPQDDPHANKAALPRESWQDQVLDASPGAAQEDELSDFSVMLHQEKHLQITKHSFRLGGKGSLLNSHPNKGSSLLFSYTNCNPSLLSYHHQLQQLRLQTAAQDSKDLGFLVDVWRVSRTEQQENLDGIAWLVSWFI